MSARALVHIALNKALKILIANAPLGQGGNRLKGQGGILVDLALSSTKQPEGAPMSHSHLPLAEHIGIKLKYLEPWAEFP